MSRSPCFATFPLIFSCTIGCSAQPEGHPTSHATVTLPTAAATPATQPTTAEATATPSTTSPAPGGTLTGTWSSAECGDKRKYPRKITFYPDGKFDAADLVSPCPPDARCVWSGIVNRSGTHASVGITVKLAIDAASNKGGAPFPESFFFEGGVLSEREGNVGCAYARR